MTVVDVGKPVRRMDRKLRAPGILGLALLLSLSMFAAAQEHVWPPAPDVPRIRLLKILPEARQAPPARSFWRAALRFIFGIRWDRPPANGFLRPTGIAVRGAAVYAADLGAGAVVRYDTQKRAFSYIPSNRRKRLPSPVGVAVASDGRVFVSDSQLRQVLVFDAQGGLLGEIQASSQPFLRPSGLALDESRGRLWVADTLAHVVHAYALAGGHLFSIGGAGSEAGRLNYPTYLAVDGRTGVLWVCDSGNFRLQSFAADGKPLKTLGSVGDRPGHLARPRGVSLDSEGHIYSVDGALSTVQIFDEDERFLLYFGEQGNEPGEFYLPGGVSVDTEDRIYVADTHNARVQVFQYLKGAP